MGEVGRLTLHVENAAGSEAYRDLGLPSSISQSVRRNQQSRVRNIAQLESTHRLKCKAFELPSFWQSRDDRVIGALSVSIKNTEGSLCIDRRITDHLEEFLFTDVMTAAVGGKNSIPLQQLQRAEVDLLVAAHGIAD